LENVNNHSSIKTKTMSFKLWPSDAKATAEKAFYVLVYVVISAVIVLGYGTMWGFFNFSYGEDVAKAGAGWHTVGALFFVASLVWLYLAEQEIVGFNSKYDATLRGGLFVFFTALSWLSYGGWSIFS
jgi:hypothetical protein